MKYAFKRFCVRVKIGIPSELPLVLFDPRDRTTRFPISSVCSERLRAQNHWNKTQLDNRAVRLDPVRIRKNIRASPTSAGWLARQDSLPTLWQRSFATA
jgi:hypothetical protein